MYSVAIHDGNCNIHLHYLNTCLIKEDGVEMEDAKAHPKPSGFEPWEPWSGHVKAKQNKLKLHLTIISYDMIQHDITQ